MFDDSETHVNGFLLKGYSNKFYIKLKKYLLKHKSFNYNIISTYIIIRMSLYTAPTLHNRTLNTLFNTSDFEENTTALTIGTVDSRYLKLSGDTETGNVIFNQAITVPSVSLVAGIITQTSGQIGYFKSFASAITGGSVQNGSVSSPAFNSLLLGPGVWMISYYHNITCTASVTFSQIVHGVTAS